MFAMYVSTKSLGTSAGTLYLVIGSPVFRAKGGGNFKTAAGFFVVQHVRTKECGVTNCTGQIVSKQEVSSLSSEVRNTLFHICGNAFFGVAAVEQSCLQFSLERQVVLEWNFWTGLAGTLDVSNSLDSLVW